MPVRSLVSSVLRWPDSAAVDDAVRCWAKDVVTAQAGVAKVGYFGSYARGDWGVGSDLDLLILVDATDVPFERRAFEWPTDRLPVPTDLLVYTLDEWRWVTMQGRFAATLQSDVVWVYEH